MEFSLIGANIVVLAKSHNPSIVSKEWLTQNKIITEQILGFTHLPVVSVIDTNNFNLMVDQDRLQLSLKKVDQKNLETLPQIISKYINQLPETPYTAIGFNYNYRLENAQKKLKDVFLINDERLTEIFSEDYAFGGIIKFVSGDFVVIFKSTQTGDKEIRGDFNFHFKSSKRGEITKKLSEHSETKKRAEKILGGLFHD